MSLPAKLARLFLVAALLVAQQGAIAHGVWHSAAGAPVQQPGTEGTLLCDQHTALGTVLGVLGNAQPVTLATVQRAAASPAATQAVAPAALPSPSSRDPPSLP